MPNCPAGHIYRKGYARKTKSGHNVRVPGSCIRATSQAGTKRSVQDRKEIAKRAKVHAKVAKMFGSKRCPAGTVERVGYSRHATRRRSYDRTSRSGKRTHLNATTVRASVTGPTCIKATGNAAKTGHKGKQLFVLERGVLAKYGYHDVKSLTVRQRHIALKRALRDGFKPLSLMRRINAQRTLNKNKDKIAAAIFADDRDWIKTTAEYKARPTAHKARSRTSGSKTAGRK